MKAWTYLKYFSYIWWNWNFRLAWFTVKHEIKGEKKYGIDSTWKEDVKKLNIGSPNVVNAEIYQGANYYLLEGLFERLRKLTSATAIIDIGCGKGRALAVAMHYGFTKLMGIEFSEDLCRKAKQNVPSAEIICVDAAEYKFSGNEEVYFFFNPFNEIVMKKVVLNIISSRPKHASVIYINPVHKEVFLNAGFREVFEMKRFRLIEGVILTHQFNTPADK